MHRVRVWIERYRVPRDDRPSVIRNGILSARYVIYLLFIGREREALDTVQGLQHTAHETAYTRLFMRAFWRTMDPGEDA